jgi:probable F420-dependent oxidoreductase
MTEELKVGMLLPTREAIVTDRPDPNRLLDFAVAAEEAGFDSVWAGESPVARPRMDPIVLLSAVAARTRDVTLGTAVVLPALRQPFLMAHSLACLDRLAEGRLVVGVGAGFPMPTTEAEFDAAGASFSQRIGRLVETIDVWRSLWTNHEPLDYEGKYFALSDVRLEPSPHQPGGPPLWLAGAGPNALRRTGRLFDGWLPYSPTTEEFAANLESIHEAARDAGRDPSDITPAMYVTVNFADDADHAELELKRYCDAYYGLPLEGMRQMQAYFGGAVEECAEWLNGYVGVGARQLVLRFGTLGDPTPMIEMAGAELLPALRAGAVSDVRAA